MATGGEEEAGRVNGIIFRTPSKKNDKTTSDNNRKLDVHTRLRMSEAENAVLQQQISLLLAEKSAIEETSAAFYTNWQFALVQCGRITEEKNEAVGKLAVISSPTIQVNSKKSRREVEQLRLALDTQNRVCEQLEHERDRANDDFQSCRAQLTTLLDNYHILATASAAVARERDAAQQEVLVLRQHLVQWKESQVTLSDEEKSNNDEMHKELVHCKERLKRVEYSRNQAVKDKQAADSIITLWQHKHENVLTENRELKEEVLAAQERISFLQEQLAVLRLHRRSGVQSSNGTVEQDSVSTNTANLTTNNSTDEVSWI